MNFKSLPQLLDFFKDENTCKEYYANIRWNGKPVCPHCGHDKVYKTDRGYKCANKACYKKFSVTVGTIFENSKVSLRYWFAAIYLCGTSKKGISSLQLARQLDITQKTAWFLLHRVREMLKDKNPALLKNEVEVDETFVGGKEKNKHANKKKGNYGRGVDGKTVVLGLVERNGKVIAKRIPDTKAESIIPHIEKHVEKGATMLTDEWYAYNRIQGYVHKTIQHNLRIYVQQRH
jgi:transposase-like protein